MKKFTSFINPLTKLFFGILLFLTVFSLPVLAEDGFGECEPEQIQIRWWNLATPGTFLPIIPSECALQDGTTLPRPLSLSVLPAILIRMVGFFTSLVWLCLLPLVIFSGIWYMWGGIDQKSTQVVITLLKQSFLGIMFLFLFYVAVFGILSILQPTFLQEDTNLSSFFSV
jgi:hypothetical protein